MSHPRSTRIVPYTSAVAVALTAGAFFSIASAGASPPSPGHFTGHSSQATQSYPGYTGNTCASYWSSRRCALRFVVKRREIRKFELSIVLAARNNGVHTYVRAAVEIPRAKLVNGRFRAIEHYPHRLPRYHHNRDRIVVSGTVSGRKARGQVRGYHSTRVSGHSIRWSVAGGRITWRATLAGAQTRSPGSLWPGGEVIGDLVTGGGSLP